MSDLISREELLHAIDEKYSPDVLTLSESVIVSWVYEMIQAFPSAEPKISRQAVIDAVTKYCLQYDLRELLSEIETMPSAESKKGKWIYCEDETMTDGFRCSECRFFEPWDYEFRSINFIQQFRFCPHCGADMREKE